jgi:adenylate cyclase
MLSPTYKRNLLKILPFGVICLVFGIIYALLVEGVLGNHPTIPSTGVPYVFDIAVPGIGGLLVGLFIGVIEVLILSKWFRNTSFLKKIIFKTGIYSVILTSLIFLITIIGQAYLMGFSPFDQRVLNRALIFLPNFSFWSLMIYVSAVIGIGLFYTEVSDNIGQGVLLNFFTGKYHHSKEEDLIFMFIDMKSSTTIAEKLGHVQYFKMLKEYYADLSLPIVQYGGEIYQYVGDEIVISWRKKKDKFNTNSLECFFAMKESLSNQSLKYESKFDVVPTFKAGIHLGNVTTGEIGVIKKEIIFSGDVLNTTARIQGLCNSYNVDLLVSEKLINALNLSAYFQIQALGETELRGRNEKINLYTASIKA